MAAQPPIEFLTTREVAEMLRVKERKVYDMAAEGEIPCRRVTGKLLFPRSEIEKWLSGDTARGDRADGLLPNVIAGSHDPLLDWAIRESGSGLATLFNGSLSGIERLRDRQAIAAGAHIFEPEAQDWNFRHVAQHLADVPVVMVTWAWRQQGILVGKDHAGRVSGVSDLRGLKIAQRQPSAGAGLLFAHLLNQAGLGPDDFAQDDELARTETEAAAAVASGSADAAPGLAAVARQFGLAFVPTMNERFDLIIDRRAWFEPPIQTLWAFARSRAFRAKVAALGGYAIEDLGTVRWNAP